MHKHLKTNSTILNTTTKPRYINIFNLTNKNKQRKHPLHLNISKIRYLNEANIRFHLFKHSK